MVNEPWQSKGGGPTQSFAGASAWPDYDFQADVKLSSLSDYPGGLRGRVDPVSGGGYALWLYPAEGLVRLYRTAAWNINLGFTQLGQASGPFDNQSFHTLKLSFHWCQIPLYRDCALLTHLGDTNHP